MSDGMPTMTHRTTFALDDASTQRLKRLASRWQISQAEVVRRSLEQAEKSIEAEKPDPIGMLRRLHENGGGIDPARAEKWIAEISENRKHWRGE
jgi:predicted transcriptional regulator